MFDKRRWENVFHYWEHMRVRGRRKTFQSNDCIMKLHDYEENDDLFNAFPGVEKLGSIVFTLRDCKNNTDFQFNFKKGYEG